ncbi:MAG: FN3 associated domain-containing protein, partial [Anaerolineales bacterium]
LFFKNVQNLNAKLESLVVAYIPEQAVKELRARLQDVFEPKTKWCYQTVLALPAVDEIDLIQDKVTLVITEPTSGTGLRSELIDFYQQTTWKNRVAFLTGSKDTYDLLIDTGKRLKAIQQILGDLQADNLKDDDPQMIQAKDISDIIQQNFHSAIRETFTLLWYPLEDGLVKADFRMKFEGNQYNGEKQVIYLLTEKMKFTQEIEDDTFRKKCEQRLFTTQSLPWIEIKKRAASNPKWQWHHSGALDSLKDRCILQDIWRQQGDYIDKGPFPQPKAKVIIKEITRDHETGEVTLSLIPANGDTVYYDIGAEATTASAKVSGGVLKIKELRASFLAVDSKNIHESGEPQSWQNTINIKHRSYQSGTDKKIELQAAPKGIIHYTTNGSNPKNAGAIYKDPFIIPKNTIYVLAYAESDGVESEVERIPIDWEQIGKVEVDLKRLAVWHRRFGYNSTKDTYEFLKQIRDYKASVSGISITISGESGDLEWVELTMHENKKVDSETIEECLSMLRKLQGAGQVQLTVERVHFETGQNLIDMVEVLRTELQPGEVKQ